MVAPNDVTETVETPVAKDVVKVVEKDATVVTEETPAIVAEETPAAAEEEAPAESEADRMARAQMLLAEGKVCYTKLAYEGANDKLSECCQIITEIEGEKAAALYEPLIYLAKTLLDLSRMEQPVVANALAGVEETADDSTVEEDESKIDGDVVDEEKMDEVADKVIEALDEGAAEADAAMEGEKPATKEDEAKEPETSAMKEDEAEEPETSETKDTDEGTDAPAEEEEDGEESTATENLSNIQLAYENAATARLIANTELAKCEPEKKNEWKANLAEALLVLGEVCTADEQFDSAIVELTACEKVQTEIWSMSDRRLADTYFQFGRAFTNMGRFTEAGDAYGKALKVITLLKEETASRLLNEEDEAKKTTLTEEVVKIEGLIKDIESWVEDSIDSHKSRLEAVKAKDNAESGSFIGTTTDKTDDKTNDISGLVRKRKADSPVKPSEETAVSGDSPSKENGGDVGTEDAAVIAKKARLSSEEAPKEEVVAE